MSANKRVREDQQIHDRLCQAVQTGVVEIHTDQRMLDFQGSPVHSPWDHLLPLLALMFVALGILLFAGVAVGIVAMTMGVFAHVYGVKYLIAWRIRSRATAYMLASPAHWHQLWHLGGIVIVLKGTSEFCMAPKGDWRKFVRRNLAGDDTRAEEPVPAPTPAAAPAPADAMLYGEPWDGDTPAGSPVQEVLPP
jgi:hypothetical protein